MTGPNETSGHPRAKHTATKRRGGMRAISTAIHDITANLAGRRPLAEAALLTNWPEIAGNAFAETCQPRRIVFSDRSRRREGTLVLRVRPGEATRVAHLEPVLVERVNGYFGYKAVARLRLEQGALDPDERRRKPELRPLDESEAREIDERLSGIRDEGLRGALARLGRTLRATDER